jgi:hypothetical protein
MRDKKAMAWIIAFLFARNAEKDIVGRKKYVYNGRDMFSIL